MNDFKGSVAQQNVEITTQVSKTNVVGGNYYENILYVTDRFSSFGEDTPEYPVVSKDTYSDVIDGYAYLPAAEKTVIKNNLMSLFAYGNVTVYIIPSAKLADYKLYGYFTYLDIEWLAAEGTSTDYTMGATAAETFAGIAGYDRDFTKLVTDYPVDPTKAKGASTATSEATLELLTAATQADIAVFVRPAMPSGSAGDSNAFLDADGVAIGYSPALYQMGRSLSVVNESGVPVGNAFDMDAVDFQNVLPTADTSTDLVSGANALFAAWFEKNHLNYFKPVGNGTSQVTNFGGWTIRANCIGADWIVAYLNYMNRIACAQIITSGKALKNGKTYSDLLNAVTANVGLMMRNGRITEFKLTAPAFSSVPKTNGHTVVIPNAWEGVYADNVREVKISGNLTVAA